MFNSKKDRIAELEAELKTKNQLLDTLILASSLKGISDCKDNTIIITYNGKQEVIEGIVKMRRDFKGFNFCDGNIKERLEIIFSRDYSDEDTAIEDIINYRDKLEKENIEDMNRW